MTNEERRRQALADAERYTKEAEALVDAHGAGMMSHPRVRRLLARAEAAERLAAHYAE